MSKYPINRKNDMGNSMTIRHCPKYKVHNHYVFTCLSTCEDFEGIVEGVVICNYNKYPPTESAVDLEPEFIIPVVDTGPLKKKEKKDG